MLLTFPMKTVKLKMEERKRQLLGTSSKNERRVELLGKCLFCLNTVTYSLNRNPEFKKESLGFSRRLKITTSDSMVSAPSTPQLSSAHVPLCTTKGSSGQIGSRMNFISWIASVSIIRL